ncbi:MAG: hypothetical protein CVV20_02380 [Gemmatimonadetes bacterium HGW-Gemmatimonadetes-1]|nr:MAG: hypothetical protein CVV20_02380 [Gemmatimonadetes bacterium HGW-Gemmatimonadetes-1]
MHTRLQVGVQRRDGAGHRWRGHRGDLELRHLVALRGEVALEVVEGGGAHAHLDRVEVGDPVAPDVQHADAVRATTLGLKNLERVMANLRPATEKPGKDYSLLNDLYGSAVGQWGRYMNHVSAIVGGAITQEKYGTGRRFEPVSKARQQEAVRFLSANAFQVPRMFLDDEILWRLESNGAVDRIRNSQTSLFRSLLSPAKLNTLVEYEARLGNSTYTLAEYLNDLRAGVWGELASRRVSVDIYRRNLQRAYLDRINAELNPPAPSATAPKPTGWGSDVRAMYRAELRTLDQMAAGASGRAADQMTRVHLADVRAEIAKILEVSR